MHVLREGVNAGPTERKESERTNERILESPKLASLLWQDASSKQLQQNSLSGSHEYDSVRWNLAHFSIHFNSLRVILHSSALFAH